MIEYRICSRCIMDTSDPDIVFDANGVCNHCAGYDRLTDKLVATATNRQGKLADVVRRIQAAGRNRPYDCVLGVSGGVDSSYTAVLAKELGLRPLAVHLDNGWNSELAVSNIERLLRKLDIDLYTYVIDWQEFRDLQKAFLTASTPDAEIPTDHAIVATLYRTAAKKGVRHVIAGCNVRTEGVLPQAWSHGHHDWHYIRSIQKQFGTKRLRSYPYYGLWHMLAFFAYRRLRFVNLLDLVDYRKEDAVARLRDEFGWREYGGKHYESVYTRFFQGYILPRKFGFDKRRAHLSALILSGQTTRDEALAQIQQTPYPETDAARDRNYVIKKLGLTDAAFDALMALPPKAFSDYPSYQTSPLYRGPFWALQRLPKLPDYIRRKFRAAR